MANPWFSVVTRNGPDLCRGVTTQIEHHLVDITPAPAFRRAIAFDDRMLGVVEVLGGVLAAGLVTAADMAAGAADPQVKPSPAQAQAFLAALAAGGDFPDRVQMGAEVVVHCAASASALR